MTILIGQMTPAPLTVAGQRSAPMILLLLSLLTTVAAWGNASYPSSSHLFTPSDEIRVVGPSTFRPPHHLLGETAQVVVEPTFGQHRSDQDAVLAYAEGYPLAVYMFFLETLAATGFAGDVVLAIADESIIEPDVIDYLKLFAEGDTSKPNVVVYQQQLECANPDGSKGRNVLRQGTDVFQMCQLPNVYGLPDATGQLLPQPDPREGRVVATIRYEWYWIWAQHYHAQAWLMLLDARDSLFQINPFSNLPRDTNGLLYFFGENTESTRLGQSKKNRLWLDRGYGSPTLQAVADKPTICSGSTLGQQAALTEYLSALVGEDDTTPVKMTGSDQGFHNYLYYSGKLSNVLAISRIVVWEQGRGIINNLGAMRIKSLKEWNIHDPTTHILYNWNGEPSPVAHQWDRDKDMHDYVTKTRYQQLLAEYKIRRKAASQAKQ